MSVQHRRGRAQRGRDASEPRSRRSGADRPPRADRRSRGEALGELHRLVEPVVGAAGFDLEEVDVRPAGRRRLVRIVVDADGGVDLDDVATLSRSVSEALDDSAATADGGAIGTGPYVLEVTSPGVERPLSEPRHWRRAAGRLVRASLAAGGTVEGRVISADDEAVVIDVAAAGRDAGGRRRFGLDELGRGRVQVEFRRPDPPAEPAEVPDEGPDEGGASWTST